MSTLVPPGPSLVPRAVPAPAPVRAAPEPPPADGGNWPRTNRILPWSIAAFVAMLWLFPFDSATLPIPLPFDFKLDRLMMVVIVGMWLVSLAAPKPLRPKIPRLGGVQLAILAFGLVALASVLVNIDTLAVLNEFNGAVKKLLLLASYVLFFYAVSTSLRPQELRAFGLFMVGLACVTAVGLVWEYRTGTNLFYTWTDALLPGVSVGAPPVDPEFGREQVSGPTRHAIATANMFAFALPFALLGYMDTRRENRFWYGLAIGLIMCACFATIRKTGALAPATALLVVFLYRPRGMLKLIPIGLAIVLLANFVIAPGSVSRVKAQLITFNDENDRSTEGRKEDYPAVAPDLAKKPALGRGHGTFESDRYRFLDNEYLQRRVETGWLGFSTYLLMIVAVAGAAFHMIRRRQTVRERSVPIAVLAGACVFGVVSVFYDALSFPQAPYMFFLLAAFAVITAQRDPQGTTTGAPTL